MADMDLDDLLDGPSKGPNRPARFAPKGSKFKPRPKIEPSQSLQPSASDSVEAFPVPKKEELGIKSDIKPEYANDAVEMDVEVKPGEKEEEKDDLMETEGTEAEVEPEDEVVREIDVYFSPCVDPKTRLMYGYIDDGARMIMEHYLFSQLYVLQYPLRQQWRPYELDQRCEEVRVKPASREVEIDLTVYVDSKNYDSGADPRVQMKKQLHLNPIHAVAQLRPLMEHVDSKESKSKSVGPSNVNDTVKSEEPQEGKKPSGSSKKLVGCLSLRLCNAYPNSLQSKISEQTKDSEEDVVIRVLLTLPLKERFRTWLLQLLEQGPPVHSSMLKHLIQDESVEEVLRVLQDHARVVQGLWVPKSSLVYGTDQGIKVLARDYVLLLFSKNVIIKDSQLPNNKLAPAMKDVLNVLAVKRDNFKDWKLKELPDFSFVKSNPSVKKQEEEWELLEKIINDTIGGRNGPGKKSDTTTNLRNIKNFQQISQLLRDMAVSESARSTGFAREAVVAANSIDAYPDELQTIINQVAVNIHGICVPKSSPDNPQYDPFRKVVIDLFVAEVPNAKLKKATILEASKMELKREISQIEYQKVLQELCLSQGSAWILRSAGGNTKH
ncbi:hypothetical protein DH2020_015857 [Rehmannia glutinosa]|uniref:DNA-directed RNA polymerase III subunit RPC5 n=1 Tax=Rehmannia glutinosa TaxID=99300 RepID=A0ABR0WXK0_REHGL